MSRIKIKQKRLTVSLNRLQVDLLSKLMAEDHVVHGEESNFFASLLARIDDCKQNHGKSKVGRPRKEDTEDETPEYKPPVDTLSFTPEELESVRKKTEKNREEALKRKQQGI